MKRLYKCISGLLIIFISNDSQAQLSGLYSINDGFSTGGTNFNSFNDLAATLNTAGVSGAVTVNVAGSMTYTEQVLFSQAPGISAAKNVVINGNGRTITYAGQSNMPWTIGLDGADYMNFQNLNVAGTNNFALVCHLFNGANNNKFEDCNISCGIINAGTNMFPFSLSGSATNPFSTGDCGNANTVKNCTLAGGYCGAGLVGNPNTPFNSSNQIYSCLLQDFRQYGIYLNNSGSTVVKNCIVERKLQNSTNATFNGVSLNGLSAGTIIDGNRFRFPGGAVVNPTFATYGVYINSSGAAGNEILIRNNLFSDLNTNGSIYGIYSPSWQYVQIYHNTISLDDASSTFNGGTYGVYLSGANTVCKNNLVSISRGGTGPKYGLYYLSGISTSSNNFVFISPAVAATAYYGYYNGAHSTHALWKTNTGLDMNGGDADPVYANTKLGDYMPQSALVLDKGTPTALGFDIRMGKRNLTFPDPGAFESSFNCSSCTRVSGKFYADCNSNCIYDQGEYGLGIPMRGRLQGMGLDVSFSPAANGDFALVLPYTGSLTLTHTVTAPGYTACNMASINLPPGPYTQTLLIGYQPTMYFDPSCSITRASQMNTSRGMRFEIRTPSNKDACGGMLPANPGKLKVILPDIMKFKNMGSFESLPSIKNAATGDTLEWNVADFFKEGAKTISVAVNGSVTTGTRYFISAFIEPSLENNISNNLSVITETVGAPHDPNLKLPYASTMNKNAEIPYDVAPDMYYSINFQNTGTSPAVDVTVVDTIESNFDLASLQTLQSSFPVCTQIDKNKREIRFTFMGINLPDSGTNEAGSHGFVRYFINRNFGLEPFTFVKNRAHIYFDYEPAVPTNLAATKLIQSLTAGISEKNEEGKMRVMPNPFKNELTVKASEPGVLSLYDAHGSLQMEFRLYQGENYVNLEAFSSGLYFLKATFTAGNCKVIKIVKTE
jgi:hypothetical protein